MKTALLIILTITNIDTSEQGRIGVGYSLAAVHPYLEWDECYEKADSLNYKSPMAVGAITAVCMPMGDVLKMD